MEVMIRGPWSAITSQHFKISYRGHRTWTMFHGPITSQHFEFSYGGYGTWYVVHGR